MLSRFPLSVALLFGMFVLAGCDSGGSSSDDASPNPTVDCDSRTGNAMAATVNGNGLCTDLGTALLSDATGTSRLSVNGLFTNGASSISFSLENPQVGTFDLADAGAEHDAFYSTADENGSYYNVDRTEGSGTVTITELSDKRVTGTFEFTGVGYDINDDPMDTETRVTDGAFDFAFGDFDFGF